MNRTSKGSFRAGLRRMMAPPFGVGVASVGAVLVGALVVGVGTLGSVSHGATGGSFLSRGIALARAAELSGANGARAKAPKEILRILEERQRKAEEQEQQARETQRHLGLLQAELDKRLEALSKERKELLKLLSRIEQREESSDISNLAKSLAETPPERAGLILGELDADLAAAILKRMNTRKAGRVWGHMKAEKAASISRALASREVQLAGMSKKKRDVVLEVPSPKASRKLYPPSLSVK